MPRRSVAFMKVVASVHHNRPESERVLGRAARTAGGPAKDLAARLTARRFGSQPGNPHSGRTGEGPCRAPDGAPLRFSAGQPAQRADRRRTLSRASSPPLGSPCCRELRADERPHEVTLAPFSLLTRPASL